MNERGMRDALMSGLRRITPEAVPAMVDCVMASTAVSPSSLFSSLLHAFPQENEKFVTEEKNFIMSSVSAFCHLLKKSGANVSAMESFIWKILIPILKSVHGHDCTVFSETADSFLNVVIETNTWVVVQESILPFCLRSLGLSMGMLQSDECAIYVWNTASVLDSNGQLINSKNNEVCTISEQENFPPHVSSCVLASILDYAIQSQYVVVSTLPTLAGESSAEIFVKYLLWDLCIMVPRMVLQSTELRSCAVKNLLPNIFQAFVPLRAFEISVRRQTHILSRSCLFRKFWMCCKTLFSMGTLERRDSYRLLSLCLSFVSCTGKNDDGYVFDGEEGFDIRTEKEFWDEMKKGLVDKEGIVRKQSLHILKMVFLESDGSNCYSDVSATKLNKEAATPNGITKKGRWAKKEAESLGIGKICNSLDSSLNSQQKWGAFFLLYEMLEEFGTHLVEAAWNHQITMLMHTSLLCDDLLNSVNEGQNQNEMEASKDIFKWLVVLWERGFMHDNPLVRCLIMESFLGIDWKSYKHCDKLVPELFVLGPFIEELNDPMHHKNFGIKGSYSSTTIEGAAIFIGQYASNLNVRKCIAFLINLVSAIKKQSFCRAGLMALTECITSAACGVKLHFNNEGYSLLTVQDQVAREKSVHNEKAEFLDGLRIIIESSKQHFNPKYRFRVCKNVLAAAVSVMEAVDVPIETLLLFISTVPREFTDKGSLRVEVQRWLSACDEQNSNFDSFGIVEPLLKRLCEFPSSFVGLHVPVKDFINYDDEDLDAWESKAQRWARVLFLLIKKNHQMDVILTLVQTYTEDLSKGKNHLVGVPVKLFILLVSLIQELQVLQEKVADSGKKAESKSGQELVETVGHLTSGESSLLIQKFANSFLSILEVLVSFAKSTCDIFWSGVVDDIDLPSSIRGKLGGPSQRRLSSFIATEVLQAIMSVKVVASITSWCAQFETEGKLNFVYIFFWNFFGKILSLQTSESETALEVRLASYEALAYVLKAVVSQFSCLAWDLIMEDYKPTSLDVEAKSLLDTLVPSFLHSVNNLIAVEKLARSRRAVLLNSKWTCLEYLLSIPSHAFNEGVYVGSSSNLITDATLHLVFGDIVDSLENAGEESVLPMLRSVRLVLELFHNRSLSSGDGVDVEMIWRLVHSSWILHVSCNKRRVAPIAALLSSILHNSVFSKKCMHEIDGEPGPLKWFVEKVLEEGTRSPRTIRLAALHLTGLWLLNPKIIQYYMKELKLLTLYGSVAFDEDFEAELAENSDARREASLLAKCSDSELAVAFINTELYARVSVSVLFNKLADLAAMVGAMDENESCGYALKSGKMFLMELLDLAVNDKDIAKELYKKYSGIHRRKIRVWQMICILSRFVDEDILQTVTSSLHISLYRNNLPAVRQYLESFGINIYLKFPSLVTEQLVPIFRNYDLRPQALSSYVFIAANVIRHAPSTVQYSHLLELLPPIIPLLTSHHHSLRGFTQLLVFQVLIKLLPPLDSCSYKVSPLEKRCFEDLKLYLANNSDCSRLRASMEHYLEDFNPNDSITPAGIFSNRIEEVEFECVPTSLMEQVTIFLNDVREDLRCSMAKDAEIIKNESLRVCEDPTSNCAEKSENTSKGEMQPQLAKELLLDFQRKIIISKHDMDDAYSDFSSWKNDNFKPLMELEKEDQLLEEILQSTTVAMEKIRGDRQSFILVGSLLDRIPNLAGLARTCEVFKAAGLAVADTNIVRDKQFQLISVTAEKWVPIIEVPLGNLKVFLLKKKCEGFSILGLEQTANSIPLDQFAFPKKTVLVLGREKEGIPVDLINFLDACIEIPQLGVVRSLNVHVSGAIALWEYTRQQRSL